MDLNLRKFAKFVDKTFIEGGKKAKTPVLLVSVAAVIKNPWIDRGFVEDLKPEILALAPKLGDILVPELIKEIGSGEKVLAYGKAGVVGVKGEIDKPLEKEKQMQIRFAVTKLIKNWYEIRDVHLSSSRMKEMIKAGKFNSEDEIKSKLSGLREKMSSEYGITFKTDYVEDEYGAK